MKYTGLPALISSEAKNPINIGGKGISIASDFMGALDNVVLPVITVGTAEFLVKTAHSDSVAVANGYYGRPQFSLNHDAGYDNPYRPAIRLRNAVGEDWSFFPRFIIPEDKWVHVAYVWNESTGRTFYVNGKTWYKDSELGTYNESAYHTAHALNFNSGERFDYAYNQVYSVSEFRLWEIERTQRQILQYMDKRLTEFDDLRAYLSFNNTLKDEVSENNLATTGTYIFIDIE